MEAETAKAAKEEVLRAIEIAQEQIYDFESRKNKLNKAELRYYQKIYDLCLPLSNCLRSEEVEKSQDWFLEQGSRLMKNLIDL